MTSKSAKQAATALKQALASSKGMPDCYLLKGLLADLAPECVAEVRLLVAAAEENVPQTLLTTRTQLGNRWSQRQAMRRLMKHRFLTEEAASFAVETWAEALHQTMPVGATKGFQFVPNQLTRLAKTRDQVAIVVVTAVCLAGLLTWVGLQVRNPTGDFEIIAEQQDKTPLPKQVLISSSNQKIPKKVLEAKHGDRAGIQPSTVKATAPPDEQALSREVELKSATLTKDLEENLYRIANQAQASSASATKEFQKRARQERLQEKIIQLNSANKSRLSSAQKSIPPARLSQASLNSPSHNSGWVAVSAANRTVAERRPKVCGIELTADGRVTFPDRRVIYLDGPTGKLRWESTLGEPHWSIAKPNRIGRLINWNREGFLLCWVYSYRQQMVIDCYQRRRQDNRIYREVWLKPKRVFSSWIKVNSEQSDVSCIDRQKLSDPAFAFEHYPKQSLISVYEIPDLARQYCPH